MCAAIKPIECRAALQRLKAGTLRRFFDKPNALVV